MKNYLKKHKKACLLGTVGLLAVVGAGVLWWNCPCVQFKRYCKEKGLCDYAVQKLSTQEKKTFVAIAKYMKKTGKAELDSGILKYASADDITEVGLKMKSCTADLARQAMLDNLKSTRDQFPGDYNCMRQTFMNELSNDEVLFLQSPQSKNLEALKNPIIKNMYLISSSKLMKCMNEEVQKKYQEEIKALNTPPAPSKGKSKK